MDLGEKMKLFMRMDALIGRKGTGAPKAFAFRLGISERSLYDNIRILKDMGGPIYFCSSRNSYCYEYKVTFSIGFLPSTSGSITQVRGGKSFTFNEEKLRLQIFCSATI